MPVHSAAAERGEAVIELSALAALIPALERRGYQVLAPIRRDSAISWRPVERIEDLAAGWTSDQSPGSYRLRKRDDAALFGSVTGQNSLKTFLHPSDFLLFTAESNGSPFRVITPEDTAPQRAFLGVRPCELAALERQDRVLIDDRYPDVAYQRRRQGVFLVAVNCTEPGGTCFCTSMGTGPDATQGYDLVLTECIDGAEHRFLIASGSPAGAEVLAEIEHRPAPAALRKSAAAKVNAARSRMGREVDTRNLRDNLFAAVENPEWERVVQTCLACGNCTQVCPTCFCVGVEDSTDVTGRRAERRRKWDSCFTSSFSYIHGGSVRQSTKSRYRQWLTHKFAAWMDQFGTYGCVGCGRCITWCPVGIDITAVIKTLTANSSQGKEPVA